MSAKKHQSQPRVFESARNVLVSLLETQRSSFSQPEVDIIEECIEQLQIVQDSVESEQRREVILVIFARLLQVLTQFDWTQFFK